MRVDELRQFSIFSQSRRAMASRRVAAFDYSPPAAAAASMLIPLPPLCVFDDDVFMLAAAAPLFIPLRFFDMRGLAARCMAVFLRVFAFAISMPAMSYARNVVRPERQAECRRQRDDFRQAATGRRRQIHHARRRFHHFRFRRRADFRRTSDGFSLSLASSALMLDFARLSHTLFRLSLP